MPTNMRKAKTSAFTVRTNPEVKHDAEIILHSLGMTLSEAIELYLVQIKMNGGIPFDIKAKFPLELNDGYGSYICEQGILHDYSKIDLENEDSHIFDTWNDAKEWLDAKDWFIFKV